MIAVNKMDLVGYDQEVFNRIRAEFEPFLERIGAKNYYFLPLSALKGDNVVDRGSHMPWFDGPCLLEYLETVDTRRQHDPGAVPHGRAARGSAGSELSAGMRGRSHPGPSGPAMKCRRCRRAGARK